MSTLSLDELRRYAYRKGRVDETYPELASVPEDLILDWFKDRYDYPRMHDIDELRALATLPVAARLEWLEHAAELVWAAKRAEWLRRRKRNG